MKTLLLVISSILSLYSTSYSAAFFELELKNLKGAVISGNVACISTDPQENGEDEPCEIHSSDGALNKQILNRWNEALFFVFNAREDNITLTCTSTEREEGVTDDSCQIVAQVNGWTAFDPKVKDVANNATKPLSLAGGLLAAATLGAGCVVGTAFLGTPVCLFLGGLTIGVGAGAGATALVAADPPDSNFTELFVPVVPVIDNLPSDVTISPEITKLGNAFLKAAAQIKAYSEAAAVSANRASGASDAGDTFWRGVQTDAAHKWLNKLGPLFGQEKSSLTSILRILEGRVIGFAFNKLVIDQRQFMSQLDLEILPQLDEFQLSEEQIVQIKSLLLVAFLPQNEPCPLTTAGTRNTLGCVTFPFVLDRVLPALSALQSGLRE